MQARVLRALMDALAHDPEAALPHARTLAAIDPLDETARAGLVRLLAATGRRREAEQQYEAACRLRQELGRAGARAGSGLARRARGGASLLRATGRPRRRPRRGRSRAWSAVGRRACVSSGLDAARQDGRAGAACSPASPGSASRACWTSSGRWRGRGRRRCSEGYAFEAEAGRPFGPWIDALRQLPPNVVTSAVGADLAALLPRAGPRGRAPQSRDRLFAAVLELLDERAAAAPPVVLAIEDVSGSTPRRPSSCTTSSGPAATGRLLVALTARAGEVSDNEAVVRALRGLRAAGVLDEIALAARSRRDQGLARAVPDDVDAERVYAESGGNPLLALEVARSLPEREERWPAPSRADPRTRGRLPSEAGDVLRWAAVLGSSFAVDRLGPLIALDLDRLLAALELLERHALLRARGKGTYEFAHEVARRAVYSDLPAPAPPHAPAHRPAAGARAARRDAGRGAGAPRGAGRRGGMAARACAAAAPPLPPPVRERGRARHRPRRAPYAAEVESSARTRLLLELLQVELQARRPADLEAAARELEALAERALEQGSAEHARLGFHLLAYLHWETGDFGDAERQMMRAEVVGRAGDEQGRLIAMARPPAALVLLGASCPARRRWCWRRGRARSARDLQPRLRRRAGHRGAPARPALTGAAELFEHVAPSSAAAPNDHMGECRESRFRHLVVLRQQQGAWTPRCRAGRWRRSRPGCPRYVEARVRARSGPLSNSRLAAPGHAR